MAAIRLRIRELAGIGRQLNPLVPLLGLYRTFQRAQIILGGVTGRATGNRKCFYRLAGLRDFSDLGLYFRRNIW